MKVSKAIKGLVLVPLLASGVVQATEPIAATVSQRWPWEQKVDIDFDVGAEDSSYDIASVTASCICKGVMTNFTLSAPALSGELDCVSGKQHLVWDPVAAGLGDESLLDFTVTVEVASFSERKYLVCNLASGEYHYLSDVPAGGWTDCDKMTNMVFRRIPAGTVRCGVTDEENRLIAASYSRAHNVRFTSDFYLAVFPMTFEQSYLIGGGAHYSGGWTMHPDIYMTYNRLRGSLADGINWPTTRYDVKEGSLVDLMRKKFGGRFLFDLPQEEQWELASRGGDDVNPWPGWPAGIDLSLDGNNQLVHGVAITNFVNTFAMTVNNPKVAQYVDVGTLDPNPFGLYDMFGLAAEWTLDADKADYGDNRPTTPDPLVDPVGREMESPTVRMVRGGYPKNQIPANTTDMARLGRVLPGFRWATGPGNTSAAGRLAIHLKSLDFDVH